MNFQREILAKLLAKLQFAMRFCPFKASFIETFGRKISKSLNISSENSPCMGMNFVIFTNIKMQTNTSISHFKLRTADNVICSGYKF